MPDHADLAPALAAFLLSSEGRAYRTPEAVILMCMDRWPDMRPDEVKRGFQIALERLNGDVTEGEAETARLKREYAARFGAVGEMPGE